MLKSKNKPQTNTEGIPKALINSYQIFIGDKVKVTEDKKSKTRIANFPFEFPDGTRGIVIVCRVKDEVWIPNKSITNITLDFA